MCVGRWGRKGPEEASPPRLGLSPKVSSELSLLPKDSPCPETGLAPESTAPRSLSESELQGQDTGLRVEQISVQILVLPLPLSSCLALASYLTSLGLSFFIHKIGLIVVPHRSVRIHWGDGKARARCLSCSPGGEPKHQRHYSKLTSNSPGPPFHILGSCHRVRNSLCRNLFPTPNPTHILSPCNLLRIQILDLDLSMVTLTPLGVGSAAQITCHPKR